MGKTIYYLEYRKNGEKVAGCGFVQSVVTEVGTSLRITVRNFPNKAEKISDVLLRGAGQEQIVGKIRLENGNGTAEINLKNPGNFGTAEINKNYPDYAWDAFWEELVISVGENASIVCSRGTMKNVMSGTKKTETEMKTAHADVQTHADVLAAEDDMGVRKIAEIQGATKEEARAEKEVEMVSEAVNKESFVDADRVPESIDVVKIEENRKETFLQEDKWSQLLDIYPHICPFEDSREYLSLRPADFVILGEASYRKACNSFMMHGFYNYNHLILTRIQQRGQELYYIGTPGNFFEQEKQIAIMFGYESFECAVEPAEEGDFGYYMMRVQV